MQPNIGLIPDASLRVEPLAALTAPFSTTFTDSVYFKGAQKHFNIIRPDGKKLSFHNGYFKTNIVEDINYLRKELAALGNGAAFEECASKDEINFADHALDPAGATERRIRAQVMEELEAKGLLRNTGAMDPHQELAKTISDGAKIAGVDAAAQARDRLAKLTGKTSTASGQVNVLSGVGAATLTPVSTSDIAAVAAGSGV